MGISTVIKLCLFSTTTITYWRPHAPSCKLTAVEIAEGDQIKYKKPIGDMTLEEKERELVEQVDQYPCLVSRTYEVCTMPYDPRVEEEELIANVLESWSSLDPAEQALPHKPNFRIHLFDIDGGGIAVMSFDGTLLWLAQIPKSTNAEVGDPVSTDRKAVYRGSARRFGHNK